MRFVAIEFDNSLNNTHVRGYLKIPENFNGSWSLGFRDYLIDKYKVKGDIKIYPLHFHVNHGDNGSVAPAGYANMEDDFNLALRSNTWYPRSPQSDATRREWSMVDSVSQDFTVKER